ncbi:hypothetical protein B0F90DRAFT_1669056 [Multifurca ochricompacta]|uniref:Zinc finger Mcm10/DnaG-type domain-containing protein n=1 Tax=Multifurca ochricompacta TaxID=376703 RepID=A0AAD4M1D2_9AGAM|nr:hypothetical protein B0F90DRAFT_1669056 [Multifurca ochricompacta]
MFRNFPPLRGSLSVGISRPVIDTTNHTHTAAEENTHEHELTFYTASPFPPHTALGSFSGEKKMESSTSRGQKELLRQQSIQRQIAQLQAQLSDPNASSYTYTIPPPEHAYGREIAKRKQSNATVLAPSSPEHKKRKIDPALLPHKPNKNAAANDYLNRDNLGKYQGTNRTTTTIAPNAERPQPPAGPSNVLSKLSALSKRETSPVDPDAPVRTSSFADKASWAAARDDRLMLIEELEPGPYRHKPPLDDPSFERLEPHSGIRLASRNLSHEDLEAYLTGVITSPHPDYIPCQVYDVPVVGDWVTIAVVAERSPIRVSRAPVTFGPGEVRDADDPHLISTNHRRLVKFRKRGARTHRRYPLARGASGKKGTSRGDAALSLLLFESDSHDTVSRGDGLLPEKIYKGGSRGAFETMAKLREGTVVALLNPRVLKPLEVAYFEPQSWLTQCACAHAGMRGLRAIIGTAHDLGMCTVLKRDGKPCGSWCDKRVSDVCDYHVQHAVERRRAGRPEFSTGTSGMSVGSGSHSQKSKATYDPQRKWGLAPAMAPLLPHRLPRWKGPPAGKRDLYLNETVGREAQARATRQASSRETDKALKRLLTRDKEGMKAVQEARKFGKKREKERRIAEGKKPSGNEKDLSRDRDRDRDRKGKGKEEQEDDTGDSEDEEEGDEATFEATIKPTKNAYSAQVIKRLGFDPTLKSSRAQRRGDDSRGLHSKLTELASCRVPDKIKLGPRPGGRVRSVVSAPKNKGGGSQTLLNEAFCKTPEGHGTVDLDESSEDDDLIVEPLAGTS